MPESSAAAEREEKQTLSPDSKRNEKVKLKWKKKQVLSEGDVLFGLAVALRRGDPASPSAMQEQQQQQQAAYQYQQAGGAAGGGGGQFEQQPLAQAAGGR